MDYDRGECIICGYDTCDIICLNICHKCCNRQCYLQASTLYYIEYGVCDFCHHIEICMMNVPICKNHVLGIKPDFSFKNKKIYFNRSEMNNYDSSDEYLEGECDEYMNNFDFEEFSTRELNKIELYSHLFCKNA